MLGLMRAYTPLHHLLLREVAGPVVATSGNLSEEPICTEEREAVDRLHGLADRFLVHDRPIARHVDDSVAWMIRGRPALLRRARGYAPRPVRVSPRLPTILGVGAHLKNTIALSVGSNVFLSQHIGDLDTPQALSAFRRVIRDFKELYDAEPVVVAHDLHPDYLSTAWAVQQATPRIAVQHHHAHLAACLADHDRRGPALGVIWDGTGYGTDGTIWGGEFLLGDARAFRRVAHLRPFHLPGGEAAVREPRRSAMALLWATFEQSAFDQDDLAPVRSFAAIERALLARLMERGIQAPRTTSAGRLFDGMAALLGLHPRTTFEGQAAIALEHIADSHERGAYPIGFANGMLDWRPVVEAAVADLRRDVSAPVVSARFHNALVDGIASVARHVGEACVVLAGGCFQNQRLTEHAARRLRGEGFEVLVHRQVPTNDGSISLGQVMVAAAKEASCR